MLVRLTAIAVLALGCSPAVSSEGPVPEESPESSRQDIVGGSTTSAFPAAGALTRYGSAHCTATLIAPRKVLTAAHCLVGVSASQLKFVIGSSISSPQASIQVASVTPHPSYDDYQLTDDIGYATLTQDAPVAPMKVMPSLDGWVGKPLVFVGYGVTSGYGSGAGVKRQVTIPISSIQAKQFSYQTPGKNTCSGDSGGPAFAQVGSEYLVAGVTSYGDPSCTQYGVDTRADVYATFLGIDTGGGGGGAGGSSGSGGAGGSGGTTPDPCGGESYEGRCNGNTVVWCESQKVYQQDCTAKNEVCGFSSANGYYECLPDPCAGETYEGRCDGNTVVWCENNEVKQLTCSTSCGYDSNAGYYNCI